MSTPHCVCMCTHTHEHTLSNHRCVSEPSPLKLIAFELAAKFSRRRENPVQPRLCNAKNAISRLKTGFSLRSRSSPANSNAITFTTLALAASAPHKYIHNTNTHVHMHTSPCCMHVQLHHHTHLISSSHSRWLLHHHIQTYTI